MEWIILGNILSLIGGTCSYISTRMKTRKQTLIVNALDATMFTLGNICLKGWSGVIINLCAAIRSLICANYSLRNWHKILIIAITLLLGVIFRDKAWYGILPIIASCYYAIVTIEDTSNIKLKKALLINNILWAIYGIMIKDIAGSMFNIINTISCIQYIIKSNNQ